MKDWWNDQAERRAGDLRHWLGDVSALTRAIVREHVMRAKYHSILDVGCGPALDREGYANLAYPIDYHGIDTCQSFVMSAQNRLLQVQQAPSHGAPFADNFFDVAYCRHVLEHLPEPEPTLNEMLRVARREVIVVWFLPPAEQETLSVDANDGCDVHHNCWSEQRICRCLWASDKVASVRWQKVNSESIMYVKLA